MEKQNEQKPGGEQVSDKVADALRHVWWAGLGLVTVAGEQSGQLLNTLVEKGKEVEPTVIEHGRKAGQKVSETMEDLAAKIGRTAGQAEAAMDAKVAAALSRIGFPTKEEIDALAAKIDALTARLEQMQKS